MKYDKLIAEIEAAEAGTRELDAKIAVVLSDIDCWDEGEEPGFIRIPGFGSVSSRSVKVKCYVSEPYNLTALMAEMPEGRIMSVGKRLKAPGYVCNLDKQRASTVAATPALALAAALLWAKQEIEND